MSENKLVPIAAIPVPGEVSPLDRRSMRTRGALMMAFRDLLFEHGLEPITVNAVADRANVGRSTFYEHFRGKEALLRACMAPMLNVLAEACCTPTPSPELTRVLAHFVERRKHARAVFGGASRPGMVRLLASLILEAFEARGAKSEPSSPLQFAAMQIAAGHIALLETWLTSPYASPPEAVARALHASSQAAASAWLTSLGDPGHPEANVR